jgi:hypothetical protein
VYTLTKINQNSYNIVLRNTTVGTAFYKESQWHSEIGTLSTIQKNLKKSVEGLLYQIIMNQIGKERNLSS